MAENQSQTTTSNTPPEPVLCKLGCGFFGNNATAGYCSKCWRDVQKTKEAAATPTCTTVPAPASTTTSDSATTSKLEQDVNMADIITKPEAVAKTVETKIEVVPTQQQSETQSTTDDVTTPSTEATTTLETTPSTEKKKKKKKNYKNMMASMMNSSSTRDTDKEKDAAIRKVTGGGAFSKIDKI